MDINFFEQTWNKKKTDKTASQVFWDFRAEEFNKRVYTGEGEERLNKILELLSSKGMLSNESTILDIGCGPGKYAIEFGKKVKNVVGIDLSPKMIDYAEENAITEGLFNTDFNVVDWEEIDIDSLGWNNKFDLVFASMCPAVNNKNTLEKMIKASRGFCFMSSFAERTDEVKDYLSKYINWQNTKGSYGKSIYCAFNILWLMGFYPEITYLDTEWEHVLPIDKAKEFYLRNFEIVQKVTDEQRNFIKEYLEKISQDGVVKEKVKAKIAWIFWKVY